MKKIILAIFILFFTYIYIVKGEKPEKNIKKPSKELSLQDRKILQTARKIIDSAYFATFISIDKQGNAKARIMEPFSPDANFVIYLATNPKSRKVREIQQHPKTTLHYFDRKNIGYVSLYGTASIVQDDSIKNALWKTGWERFYKNRDKDYMLIKFVPDYLELISIPDGYTGDDKTWMPSRVDFYVQK